MNYSEKHSKLFVYPITCHKWNLEAPLSTLIGYQRITCSKIIHLSFFTCWCAGQTIQVYLSSLVNGEHWSLSRGQKTGQLCIVYYQKHIHLSKGPYLRSTVCGQPKLCRKQTHDVAKAKTARPTSQMFRRLRTRAKRVLAIAQRMKQLIHRHNLPPRKTMLRKFTRGWRSFAQKVRDRVAVGVFVPKT